MSEAIKIEKTIGEAIGWLSNGSIDQAAGAIREVAHIINKAGYGYNYFLDIRKRIIRQAEIDAGAIVMDTPRGPYSSIRSKLEAAEAKLKRQGATIQ